jgi:hypothetical protein
MSPHQGGALLAGAAALTLWDTACAAPARLAPPAPLAAAGPIVTAPRLFTDDDLLLFAVSSAGMELSDGFEAYSSRAGVFLPVGALARLLDIDITVDPQRQRAEGWVLTPDHTIRIDALAHRIIVAGDETGLDATEAAFKDGDLWVRTSVLEKILPIKITADTAGLNLTITPTQTLPFQARLERELRRGQFAGANGAEAPPLEIATPYRLFTLPSFDLNLTAGVGNHSPKRTGSYDVRAAGDLGGAGVQLFAGSDGDFRLDTVRLLFSRKDPAGRVAGPFGATRSSLGDTFTPTLPLGARSAAGRGVAITSEPLEQASVFDRTDLRGELPLGYQVELYVNEVLRGSQLQPVQGRYEFQGVTLAYGLNVIRLVFYGPRGERREDVRRINVGGGELAKGQTTYSFGAVQEGRNLLQVGRSADTSNDQAGAGKWRITAALAHGFTNATTLTAAFAQYTPRRDDTRQIGTVGLVTSFAGAAVQLDGAVDNTGGEALAAGLAGRYGAASIVARHSEYRGGFIDEVQSAGVGTIPLRRNTNVSVDTVLNLGRSEIPASFHVARDEFEDGAQDIQAGARLSKAVSRYLVSSAFQYEHRSGGGSPGQDILNGALDMSGLVDAVWQLRAGMSYTAVPKLKLEAAGFTADRNIGERTALHLGVNHTFGDSGQTTFEAGQTWRFQPADISLVTSYTTKINDVRLSLQLSLGFGYDPWRSRYALLGPGAAAGGAMAVDAFVDANGNGARDPGEKPLPGLIVQGGRRPQTTDADGRALITGLGDGASALAQIDMSSLDDPYLVPSAPAVKVVPRPGRVALVAYPVTVSGEVELQVQFQRAGEAPRAISALHVELVGADGQVAASGSSAFDGALVLENLRPGTYAVRIEPAQAARLKLTLVKAVAVKIAPGGGFAGRLPLLVTTQTTIATNSETPQ